MPGPPFPHLLWEYYMHYEVRHPIFLEFFSITACTWPYVTLNIDLNLWKMRNSALWRLQYHTLIASSVNPEMTGLLRDCIFILSLVVTWTRRKIQGLWGALSPHIAAWSPCILSFPQSSSTLGGKGVSSVATTNIFSVIFVVASEDYLWIIAIWGKLCSKSFLY